MTDTSTPAPPPLERGTLHVVVGGQFGSEAKGAVCAWLCANQPEISTAVRVAGPNAGHTAYDKSGRAWALRQIPVAAVVRDDLKLVIAAGSEVDPDVLAHEIRTLGDGGIDVRHRLVVDATATVIDREHIEAEGGYGGELTQRLGSTAKGVGAARAERIWRRARTWGQVDGANYRYGGISPRTDLILNHALSIGQSVVIEGTQGYGLGVHTSYYPQCTSSDCRAVDFAAMAGVNPWDADHVEAWVVLRTFPIRVAGNSGPLNYEVTWEQLADESDGHIQPERTTVTKKVRRVGRWDPTLAYQSVQAQGGAARIALTFLDYIDPRVAGITSVDGLTEKAWDFIRKVQFDVGRPVDLVGTGPNSMVDLRPFK